MHYAETEAEPKIKDEYSDIMEALFQKKRAKNTHMTPQMDP